MGKQGWEYMNHLAVQLPGSGNCNLNEATFRLPLLLYLPGLLPAKLCKNIRLTIRPILDCHSTYYTVGSWGTSDLFRQFRINLYRRSLDFINRAFDAVYRY